MSTSDKKQNKMLYEQMQSEIEKDKLYWIKNDAKIRACSTSKNYDEFREIVAAAHLKSLSRQDLSRKQPEWKSTDLE